MAHKAGAAAVNCPKCHAATYVADSRPAGASVRRRRMCGKCGTKLTTFESPLNLVDLFGALRSRLRHLEEEIGAVVDLAARYMAGRVKRPKRGPSRSTRVVDVLHRRRSTPLDPAERERLVAAYNAAATRRELANELGLSISQLHWRLSRYKIRKRDLMNGGAS